LLAESAKPLPLPLPLARTELRRVIIDYLSILQDSVAVRSFGDVDAVGFEDDP